MLTKANKVGSAKYWGPPTTPPVGWHEMIQTLSWLKFLQLTYCPYCDLLSECSLASPGSPCTDLEAEDCKYKHIGKHCCCGQCSDSHWLSLACVLNSTTGAGSWQPTDSLCPAEGCGIEGELWDLGEQKVKFGSKRTIFGVIWFFWGVWTLFGNQPPHPPTFGRNLP